MKANILIIDDDPNKLNVLEIILKSLDQHIIKCQSGEEGLRALLENEIAVILLDINMPGLDGFETAKLIRERTKTSTVPIIFITAYHKGEFDVSKGYSLGAVDYIFFPFNETFLLSKLKVFLDIYFLRRKEQIQSTELVKANKDLLKSNEKLARSNKELEVFAYVASHDLQEPLRMITMFTQLLYKKYYDKLDQDANEYINYAVDGAKRMQMLINDLLQYSRISSKAKKFEMADMSKILSQSLANLETMITENSAIITHDDLPAIPCDESQIMRLFQNLISNAIKFGKDSVAPEIHISCEQKNGTYLFSVSDNGIGIASEYFDKIFVIFQRIESQGKYPGTGIGLSICKRIVEWHEGRIWLESKENEGTTFYFTLPKEK
jgi:two-component system, sensor histidine kinase and response regulator